MEFAPNYSLTHVMQIEDEAPSAASPQPQLLIHFQEPSLLQG